MFDKTVHKNILIKILKDIYTDNFLGALLGFKGGTAALLFYGLDRFSVDLDFDLFDEQKEEDVFEKVEEIIKKYGFKIVDKKNKENTLFFSFSYSEESKNIKIEINKRNFGSQYEVKNYLGISMLVMRKEDMFAHKLVALTERRETISRDVFDINFFFNREWDINKRIVEERTGVKFNDYLEECIKSVKRIPDNRVLSGLGELIDERKKTAVKENLKKETIFLLRLMLKNEENKE
jgi:predicted nucleotidyltransferase component of viral defense system